MNVNGFGNSAGIHSLPSSTPARRSAPAPEPSPAPATDAFVASPAPAATVESSAPAKAESSAPAAATAAPEPKFGTFVAGRDDVNAFYSPTDGMFMADGKGSWGYLGRPDGDPDGFRLREPQADANGASGKLAWGHGGHDEPNAFYSRDEGMFLSDGRGSWGYVGRPASDPDGFQQRSGAAAPKELPPSDQGFLLS